MLTFLGLESNKPVDTTKLELLLNPLIDATREVIEQCPPALYEELHKTFSQLDQVQLQRLQIALCNKDAERLNKFQSIYNLACQFAKQKKEAVHGQATIDSEKRRLQVAATKLQSLLNLLKPILISEDQVIHKLPKKLFILLHNEYLKLGVEEAHDLYTIACGTSVRKRSKLDLALQLSKEEAVANPSVPSDAPVLSQPSVNAQSQPQIIVQEVAEPPPLQQPQPALSVPRHEEASPVQLAVEVKPMADALSQPQVQPPTIVQEVIEPQPQPAFLVPIGANPNDVVSVSSSSLSITESSPIVHSPIQPSVSVIPVSTYSQTERSFARAALQSSIEIRAQLDNAIDIIHGIISSAKTILSNISSRITATSATTKLVEGSIHIAQAEIQLTNLKQLQELMEIQKTEMTRSEEAIEIKAEASSDQQNSLLEANSLKACKTIQLAAANIKHAYLLAQGPAQFIRAEILEAKASFNEARALQQQEDEHSLVKNALSSLESNLTQINAKVVEIESNLENVKATYASSSKLIVAPSASSNLHSAQAQVNQLSFILENLKNAQELINSNHAKAKEAERIFVANFQVPVALAEEQRAEHLRTSGLAIRFAAQNVESILPMVQKQVENAGSALSEFNLNIQQANALQEQYVSVARDLAEKLKLQQLALETSKPAIVLPEVEQLIQQHGAPLLAAMAIMQFAAVPQLAQQLSNKHKDLVATYIYGI